ncbi:hypothetical protein LV478_11705 [Komagataeibacter oboediens]|uniref:hypothetical protein n=1 Tax=Komagataeibacter oboediens TaxID=65958 RepID=UPI0023DB02E8|nr:hypothetical protein [Komagataeibacter oboediens]WEQ51195.1 hypothetical protein LV478_11705 [Komagataeibacter oboediens]
MIATATILSATALILLGWSRTCRHEWEVMDEWQMMEDGHDYPVGTKYIQRCTKCGKMKQVTL